MVKSIQVYIHFLKTLKKYMGMVNAKSEEYLLLGVCVGVVERKGNGV